MFVQEMVGRLSEEDQRKGADAIGWTQAGAISNLVSKVKQTNFPCTVLLADEHKHLI
jgi:hypothetical protein